MAVKVTEHQFLKFAGDSLDLSIRESRGSIRQLTSPWFDPDCTVQLLNEISESEMPQSYRTLLAQLKPVRSCLFSSS